MMLYRRPRLGVTICIGLITAGCISSAFVTWYFDYPPILAGREFEMFRLIADSHHFVWMLMHTYHYLPSYFMAVLIGYHFIQCPDDSELKYSPRFWLFSTGFAAIGVVFLFHHTVNTYHFSVHDSRLVKIVYSGLFRLAMSCLLVPTFYLTRFGFIKNYWFYSTLKWKIWTVMSRLTFSVFLTHILIISFLLSVVYDRLETNFLANVLLIIDYIVICYVFALLVYIFVEAPFANLVNSYFKHQISLKTDKHVVNNNSSKKQD